MEEERRLRYWIHQMCQRPGMYFGESASDLMFAYLDGYAHGRGGEDAHDWSGFRHWLAERLYRTDGVARNLAHNVYLRHLYPDDAVLFAELPKLFDRFLEERDGEGN